MKKLTFNTTINNRNYNFFATWSSNHKITSVFSSNIDGTYDGEISLYDSQASNFLYCLEKLDIKKLGNKHQSKDNLENDCILTFNDNNELTQNKWNMYTFPKNVDYLYTAIALCDAKFLNVFKRVCD